MNYLTVNYGAISDIIEWNLNTRFTDMQSYIPATL